MKTASILPQGLLKHAAADDYHMALAHLIGKDGYEEYTNFFEAIGQFQDKFLIMDTGLIEGDPRPIDELVEKAKRLWADEMVLPDVFENKDETLRESHDALEYVEHHLPNIRKMAVPQGVDIHDWFECAKEMLTWPIDTIGIPKVLCRDGGMHARLEAITMIQPYLGDKEIHLLGCWDSPLELKLIENHVRSGKIKPVRGVDSAIAYVYANKGIRITDDERPAGAIDFKDGTADAELLEYNLSVWRSEAATLESIEEIATKKIRHLL